MSALKSEDEYGASRRGIVALLAAINRRYGPRRVYCPAVEVATMAQFASETTAMQQDLRALAESRLFLMVYPGKLVSSVLVEAGIAIGLGIPCLFIVRDVSDLPYMLRQAGDAKLVSSAQIVTCRDIDACGKQIDDQGLALLDDLFGAAAKHH
jgi:hypothetical protein